MKTLRLLIKKKLYSLLPNSLATYLYIQKYEEMPHINEKPDVITEEVETPLMNMKIDGAVGNDRVEWNC